MMATRPLDLAVLAAEGTARERLGRALEGLGRVRLAARLDDLRAPPRPDAVVAHVPADGPSPVGALRADPDLGLLVVVAVCEGSTAPALAEGADEALAAAAADLPARVRTRAEVHRRRQERMAADAAASAGAASRAKDELLSTVAHDLRSPLGSILLWAELLRHERPDAETTERALGVLERSARCLARVVDELSAAAPVLAEGPAREPGPVDLVALVEAAVAGAREAAGARSVGIRAAVDRTAGPVVGDEARLGPALARLLSGAVARAPAGGEVEVGLGRAGGGAQLRVRTSGAGAGEAPPAAGTAPRPDPPCREGNLGLIVLRHLVAAAGGRVEAEVTAGALVVGVQLPLAPPPGSPEDGLGPALRGVRVLVVEDDADARAGLEALLLRWGARVEAVGSVPEALRALAAGAPDLLLSDLALPGEDGLGLVRRLREREAGRARHLPALALTARAGARDREEALRAGFDEHLPKPFDHQRLGEALRRLLAPGPPGRAGSGPART